jgi:biopolymer transport protein TolR
VSVAARTRAGRVVVIRPGSRAQSEINVTPLVDVVLVLLIIFMVVTPLLEKDIGVQIPDTEKAAEPERVPPNQVLVTLGPDGELALNGEPILQDAFVETLRARFEGRGRRALFVTADDAAPYPRLVAVLDGARRAGAETLGMTATHDPTEPANANATNAANGANGANGANEK